MVSSKCLESLRFVFICWIAMGAVQFGEGDKRKEVWGVTLPRSGPVRC